MTIDVFKDELILLADAGEMLPEPPSVTTINRWWKRGIRGVVL